MSLHLAAQHLAAKGRGPDDTLVHMSKDEVRSLQQLAKHHGGDLTINPETGLPEAGFLSRILPMLAGGALTVMSGGALSPLMAAGIVGGGYGLATHSLGKGLMAGLGAYGGAGLGAGLAGAGTASIGSEAVQNATTDAAAKGLTGDAYNQAVQSSVADKMAAITPTQSLTAGANQLFTNPSNTLAAIGGGNAWTGAGNIATAAAPAVLGTIADQRRKNTDTPGDKFNPYEYSYDYTKDQYTRQPVGYQNSLTQTVPRQMADGGYAYSYDPATQSYSQTSGPTASVSNTSGVLGRMEDYIHNHPTPNAYSYAYNPANQGFTQLSAPKPEAPVSSGTFEGIGGGGGAGAGEGGQANGGLMAAMASGGMSGYNLGGYSDGGRLLRGPGDGVSDSIPATIGDKQPARLADGEFVVPARIVSELGNGSTEAGARKLYAMMDRVQNARGKTVGKGRVATNSRADKHLPA